MSGRFSTPFAGFSSPWADELVADLQLELGRFNNARAKSNSMRHEARGPGRPIEVTGKEWGTSGGGVCWPHSHHSIPYMNFKFKSSSFDPRPPAFWKETAESEELQPFIPRDFVPFS